MFSSWFIVAISATEGSPTARPWSELGLSILKLRVLVTQSSDTWRSRIAGGATKGDGKACGKGFAGTPPSDMRFYNRRIVSELNSPQNRQRTRTFGRSYGLLGDGGERGRFTLPDRGVRKVGERMSMSMVAQSTALYLRSKQ